MGVLDVAVGMGVLVDQVHRAQQGAVAQHLGGGPVGGDPVVFAEDDAAVGQFGQRLQVVGGQHHGLAGPTQLDDQVDEPPLGAGVEGGGGLVEQEHLGVH